MNNDNKVNDSEYNNSEKLLNDDSNGLSANQDISNVDFATNNDLGNNLMDLYSSNLSEVFFAEMRCVENIINELLSNTNSLKQLLLNPTDFYSEREITCEIKLSPDQKKLLTAFADDDVIKHVKSNNVKDFVKTCIEKGYVNQHIYNRVNINDIKKYFKTEKDFDEFVKKYGNNDVKSAFVLLVPVLVAGVVVGLYIAGAITMVVFASTAVWEVAVIGKKQIKELFRDGNYDPIVRLWYDNALPSIDNSKFKNVIIEQSNLVMNTIEDYIDEDCKERVLKIITEQLTGYYYYYGLLNNI